MADAPYLVAIALVEQAGERLMPINGKSQSSDAAHAAEPGEAGLSLTLELLLRLWQRSDEAPLKRAEGAASLLVLELPLEIMSEQLPLIKANWISSGATEELLNRLRSLAIRGWTIRCAKYEPISFVTWS
jgi:hypothetical protein